VVVQVAAVVAVLINLDTVAIMNQASLVKVVMVYIEMLGGLRDLLLVLVGGVVQ
jgi:hypothetical protein